VKARKKVVILFLSIILIPFFFNLFITARHKRKIENINQKYDQILKEIKKCQTKECIDEQMD